MLFTARKSLLKNLVILSNSSCSLSGQEFRQSLSVWVLCFRVSYKAASRVPPGTTVVCVLVHLRQDLRFGSLLGCLVVYIPSLMGCWTQGLSSLLAVGWRPPSVPWHMASLVWQFTALVWLAHKGSGERVSARWINIWLLISEVTSHHFCYIVSLRSKSLGPALTTCLSIPEGALGSMSEALKQM